MTLQNIHRFITLHDTDCRYRFFPAGDVYDFVCGSAMANLFRGNARDGSLNNIYLRIYGEDSVTAHPLLGIASGSRVRYSSTALVQTSRAKPISCVTITIVIPSSASSRIRSSTSPTISGSSAEVGSSKSMTCGFIASARTMAMRCFCPPERVEG